MDGYVVEIDASVRVLVVRGSQCSVLEGVGWEGWCVRSRGAPSLDVEGGRLAAGYVPLQIASPVSLPQHACTRPAPCTRAHRQPHVLVWGPEQRAVLDFGVPHAALPTVVQLLAALPTCGGVALAAGQPVRVCN